MRGEGIDLHICDIGKPEMPQLTEKGDWGTIKTEMDICTVFCYFQCVLIKSLSFS